MDGKPQFHMFLYLISRKKNFPKLILINKQAKVTLNTLRKSKIIPSERRKQR